MCVIVTFFNYSVLVSGVRQPEFGTKFYAKIPYIISFSSSHLFIFFLLEIKEKFKALAHLGLAVEPLACGCLFIIVGVYVYCIRSVSLIVVNVSLPSDDDVYFVMRTGLPLPSAAEDMPSRGCEELRLLTLRPDGPRSQRTGPGGVLALMIADFLYLRSNEKKNKRNNVHANDAEKLMMAEKNYQKRQ
jgi:hypothetical protein